MKDPVEALLEFLILLRRFISQYGTREPVVDLDDELTRARGTDRTLNRMRRKRTSRLRSVDAFNK